MIANSESGSVDPDAVTASAIMKFRSTLKNVEAPIPVDEPIQVPKVYTPANTVINKPNSASPIVDSSTVGNLLYQTGSSTGDAILNRLLQTVDTSDVYNEGELYCNDTLNTYFKAASEKYNVDVKLLKAMAKAESDFNPYDTSKSGAMGIMQLMPATAKYYGVENPYNAYENIMGGAHLMADNLGRFNGDITKAVAAYNCGGKPVEEANGVPEIEQTQKYVANVLKYYNYS
ncbi:MAG: lytic transglycosylase domain-containing protein [Lachnospiraceae bacterium]|nr:lytic transglycosylase domain-containing protein [Lachnospiraceae bacterium]